MDTKAKRSMSYTSSTHGSTAGAKPGIDSGLATVEGCKGYSGPDVTEKAQRAKAEKIGKG